MTHSKGKETTSSSGVVTRDPTICKKVIQKRHKHQKYSLNWNYKGQACGANRHKALKIFQAQTANAKQSRKGVKWDTIKCPRQSVGTIDCGCYVMRFMKEIIDKGERRVPKEYLNGYEGRAYTQEEINNIREEWATYIQNII